MLLFDEDEFSIGDDGFAFDAGVEIEFMPDVELVPATAATAAAAAALTASSLKFESAAIAAIAAAA